MSCFTHDLTRSRQDASRISHILTTTPVDGNALAAELYSLAQQVITRRARNYPDRDSLCQELVLEAYKARKKWDPIKSPRAEAYFAWIMTMTVYKSHRSRVRRARHESTLRSRVESLMTRRRRSGGTLEYLG